MHSGRFPFYSSKRKISQNDHSLSLVVICCHSLAFVVTRCTTRFHLLYHSLSLVVTRCISCLSFYKRLFKSSIYITLSHIFCKFPRILINGFVFVQRFQISLKFQISFFMLEIPVNLIQYRGTVGVFNDRNFSFNYKSHFKAHINRMALSYTVLNKENFSISNISQILLILISLFLSLKYKYCIIGRHFFLYIFILTSILVVLQFWHIQTFYYQC